MENELEVSYEAFKEADLKSDCPLLVYAFEGQEDVGISSKFPEIEYRRCSIEKIKRKGDETVLLSIMRGRTPITVGLVYVNYPWKKQKVFDTNSINFLREVTAQTVIATKQLCKERYQKVAVLLPSRFSPQNIQDQPNREKLAFFIRTVVEAIVYANTSYDNLFSEPNTKLKEINFLFLSKPKRSLDTFLRKALNDGLDLGRATSFTRYLTELPANIRTPKRILEIVLGKQVDIEPSNSWQKFNISPKLSAKVLYGVEGLRAKGFELIASVGQGSQHEPYLLELHYKPQTRRQKNVRRIAITAKGVNFDTGGLDLKLTGYYENMNYDICGAATVLGAFQLAEEKNLPVELFAVIPVVENAVGSKATLPGSVLKSYGGKTVEIVNTDAEGRLLMAEAIAYAEKELKPHTIVTVATLGSIDDFAPDILQVVVTTASLKKKAEIAERLSSEKVLFFPPPEYLNRVDDMHLGTKSDLVNDVGVYHTAPTSFMYNFFSKQPVRWLYLDVGVIFEENAHDYGAGPGFGVKFLWHFLEQFA